MNKGITISQATISQAKNSLIMTRRAKIPIQLNLIIGYVGENNEALEAAKLFIKENINTKSRFFK